MGENQPTIAGLYLVDGPTSKSTNRVEVYIVGEELWWSFYGETKAYKLDKCKLRNARPVTRGVSV